MDKRWKTEVILMVWITFSAPPKPRLQYVIAFSEGEAIRIQEQLGRGGCLIHSVIRLC